MQDILMPSLGENVKEGVVINVLIKPGDSVEKGQTLIEVETDKVTFEVPSEVVGQATEVLVKKGDILQPGALILKLQPATPLTGEIAGQPSVMQALENPPSPAAKKPSEAVAEVSVLTVPYTVKKNGKPAEERRKILSTPLARKLARELGIEISEIGTALNKRISFNDVKTFTRNRIMEGSVKAFHSAVSLPPLPDFDRFGKTSRQAMSGMMTATSRNMTLSASAIPHAWLQEKADITELEARRRKYKSATAQEGGNLTLTVLVISAVAKALKKFPLLNASLDTGRNEIIFKDYYHIGVAVDSGRGLLVPVIRDADKRSVTEIAVELTRISNEVKEAKVKPGDMEGGTFTISNLGGIGTTGMNPLISWPQAAILGLSASQNEPVWEENGFVPRLKLPMSLGFDHRVINGADAARFLQHLKHTLEDFFLLLL